MSPRGEPTILVLNIGSSSLKYALFPLRPADECLQSGNLEHRATADREAAVDSLLDGLEQQTALGTIQAVGHRVVHGGERLREPVLVDAAVRRSLGELIPLAPDHLPVELRAVDAISRRLPATPQVLCFDTAFHSRMPATARLFGLPRALTDAGVVRYGFHGISYEYIVDHLRSHGQLARRTIVAHLGNGASLAALLDGVSIDTSMGMTPTGGVVMSTRSGDLDPGVALYLLRAHSFSQRDLENAVDKAGGLLGISDCSADMRYLLSVSTVNPRAAEAIGVFCYQIRKFVGAYAAALGGLDLLVFTGGIGEHLPEIRERVCQDLGFLGVTLDPAKNVAGAESISGEDSAVRVAVVKTNEELTIARHVRRVLRDREGPLAPRSARS